MGKQLESALVIALRDTIKWESAVLSSGTLTPVDPVQPFDCTDYQRRDRQLAYRDLIIGSAVVEVAVQVGDVWNYTVNKPTLQGPTELVLPLDLAAAGTYSSQVRHVLQTSIPYDAARYADADLYGRDALVYEVLARACQQAFTDPGITPADPTGAVIPGTSVWSLAEGAASRSDINACLPLNRDLFKKPDQNLADRDNQLAGYVAQLCQQLKNPFAHALRLYVQTESYGQLEREPDIYALISDDGTHRVFQAEPALSGGNQITYDVQAQTLQWVREQVDEAHVPQIYAMAIQGIDLGQTITTLPQVPPTKDAQYWRAKAGLLVPDGVRCADTTVEVLRTDTGQVSGGLIQGKVTGGYTQGRNASLTVPGVIVFEPGGTLAAGNYRVNVLAKPSNRVELMGELNTLNSSGTLGGVTFDVAVASGAIAEKQYLVLEGDGIVYNGVTYLQGDTFYGVSGVTTYTQSGAIPSAVRQYSVAYRMALPAGSWNVQLEFTNLSGSTNSFDLKAEYVATGASGVPVIQDISPTRFTGNNGDIVVTPVATMDVRSSGEFTFPIYWTGGEGQLHVRRLLFESAVTSGHYSMSGTFGGSVAQVDVVGESGVPAVLCWDYYFGTAVANPVFNIDYATDTTLTPALPILLEQLQVQSQSVYAPTPLSLGFRSWRQECLDRATRAIAQSYQTTVKAYGTALPTFRDSGSHWSTDASEAWMHFVEIGHPRAREYQGVAQDALADGRQYKVTVSPVVYNGTTYTDGQKFYCTTAAGTVYTSGTVAQVGAFIKSKPGHLGRPALMPTGLYFDDETKTVKAYYDTAQSVPQLVTCQPWMIESGLYVAQDDFWMAPAYGLQLLSAGTVPPPRPFFTGSPTAGSAPLTVTFNNMSINLTDDTTFLWDFGD